MRLLTLVSAMALLATGSTVNAQDTEEEPEMKLVLSSYQCDWNDAIPWMNRMDSLQKPVWQELVDEGKIAGWGVLRHDFAGYDNVIVWRVATSLAAVEEAQMEMGRRLDERHPDLEPSACSNHHDAIYSLAAGTGPPRDGFPTVVLSYYKCESSERWDIAESIDSLMRPIAQEMVDENMFGSWGFMVHDWAGMETLVQYRSAPDRASFFEAWAEFGRRLNERHPGADPFMGCNQHRDGLYVEVTRTSAPSQAE